MCAYMFLFWAENQAGLISYISAKVTLPSELQILVDFCDAFCYLLFHLNTLKEKESIV